jgi:uncharacterized Zn-finger protein
MAQTPTDTPPEIILVEARQVACDGGGGALGHPRVWYEMGDDTQVDCKYCDRRFVLRDGADDRQTR